MKRKIVATLIAKCTTCKRKYEVHRIHLAEARDFGCLFSPCCRAVATVHSVTAKAGKQ